MLPISIFIIAQNEADRIGETIRAVRELSDDLHRGSIPARRTARKRQLKPWAHGWFTTRGPATGPRNASVKISPLQLDAEPRRRRGRSKPISWPRSKRCLPAASPGATPTRSESRKFSPVKLRPTPAAYALAPVRLTAGIGVLLPSLVHDRVDLEPSLQRLAVEGHHPSPIGPIARKPDRKAKPLLGQTGGRPRHPGRHHPDMAPVFRTPRRVPESLYRAAARGFAGHMGF